jgi:hypothetical protein
MSRTDSLRWLAAIVAGVVVGMFALTGTAAAPPAGAPVRIIDADNADQVAHVDADGNLQVGGMVSVDGTVAIDSSTPVATTSTDDSGRTVFQREVNVPIADGLTGMSASLNVPEGTRLVISHVSARVELPTGQKVLAVIVQSTAGGPGDHSFVPVLTGTAPNGRDVFVVSQDTTVYANPPSLLVAVNRDASLAAGTFQISISGYLIDCSVAPCN